MNPCKKIASVSESIIKQTQSLISAINVLRLNASTPVERVDLADIKSDLESALEKLEVLRQYQHSPTTDYDQLWDCRRQELKEYQRTRDAWVRTEILTQLLRDQSN